MNGNARLAVAVAAVVALVSITVPAAWAQGPCSLTTLKGTYGLVEQGTIVMPGVMGLPVGAPTANVALVTYDGAGNLSATFTANFGGMPLKGSVVGTYTVEPDCTYTDDVPAVQIRRSGTITGEGLSQQVRTIFTVPWLVGGGTRWKMSGGNCTAAILRGSYSLFGQGSVVVPGNPPLLGRQVGVITYNGRGNFYGSESVNLGGETEHNEFTGTYAVGSNCSIAGDISSSSGLNLRAIGFIAGEGVRQAVHIIIAEPGWVFVAAIDRQ